MQKCPALSKQHFLDRRIQFVTKKNTEIREIHYLTINFFDMLKINKIAVIQYLFGQIYAYQNISCI